MTSHRQHSSSVTLSDVAKKAGVSRSTASRALNASPRISKATTARVHKVAAELGFVVNAQGRALAMGHSETIAVLITEPLDEFFADPTYGAMLRGISEQLTTTSYLPILMQASSTFERSRILRHLERRTVDAVIDISPYEGVGLLEVIKELHLPTVLCGQLENDPYTGIFSNVYSDDVEGALIAATAMRERGRHRIIAILGPKSNPAVPDRLRGYRKVLGKELPDNRVIFTGWDEASGYRTINQLLKKDEVIDGVLAGSDRIACGVLDALSMQGIEVPERVSVIGYDDHPIAECTKPALTTIRQPLREEGRLAAQIAVDMANGASPTTKVLHMELVSRNSL